MKVKLASGLSGGWRRPQRAGLAGGAGTPTGFGYGSTAAHDRARPGNRAEQAGQLLGGRAPEPGPGPRRGQIRRVLHGAMGSRARRSGPAVGGKPAAVGQPGLRRVPLLVGPAADRLQHPAVQVQPGA
jgi:hypothetical protein